MENFLRLFSLAILCSAAYSAGQASQVKFDFTQGNRTYGLTDSLVLERNFADRWRLSLTNRSNLLLVKKAFLAGTRDRLQKYTTSELALAYQLSGKTEVGVSLKREISTTDPLGYALSRFSGLVKWTPVQAFSLTHQLGIADQSKDSDLSQKANAGAHSQSELRWQKALPNIGSLRLGAGQSFLELKRLPARESNLSAVLKRTGGLVDTLSVELRQRWAKKTYYFDERALSTTARQNVNSSFIDGKLARRWPGDWSAVFEYQYNRQENRYRPETVSDVLRDTLTLDLQRRQNTLWNQEVRATIGKQVKNAVGVKLGWRWEEAEEDYGVNFKDQRRESGELSGTIGVGPTNSDTLALFGSFGVTSYFVPPVSGFLSDRDLLNSTVSIFAAHRFSPYFGLNVTGSRRLLKQIYLSGRYSANNRTTDNYLLAPVFSYHLPHGFSIRQGFNLGANYVTFDFLKTSPNADHTILRQASSASELTLPLTDRLNWILGYTYRYEDFGGLLWRNQWVQETAWDRRTHISDLRFTYQWTKPLNISGGFIWEQKFTYDHIAKLGSDAIQRIRSSSFIRKTVTFGLTYALDGANFLRADYQRRAQSGSGFSVGDADWATVSYGRTF